MNQDLIFWVVFKDSRYNSNRNLLCSEFSLLKFEDQQRFLKNGNVLATYTAAQFGANGIAYMASERADSTDKNYKIYTFKYGDRVVYSYDSNENNYTYDLSFRNRDSVFLVIMRDKNMSIESQAAVLGGWIMTLNNMKMNPLPINKFITAPANAIFCPTSKLYEFSSVSNIPPKSYMLTLDHGQLLFDPTQPRFDPGAGETGQYVNPDLPLRPYSITLDHGVIEVDPNEPRFDPGAGETGQWTNPSSLPPDYSPYN